MIVTGQMQRSGVEFEVLLGGEAYLVKLLSLSSSETSTLRQPGGPTRPLRSETSRGKVSEQL